MKKIVIGLMMAAIVLVGCNSSASATNNESMFSLVEGDCTSSYSIVYHKETKVMYAVSQGSHNYGNFTVLVNADGSPMLWSD